MFEWIELFSNLSKQEQDTMSLFCQERQVKAWEILFNKWEESNSMYIVKTWLLEAYDEDKILGIIKPKEFVWEMSIFEKPKVRTASVKALENSNLIVLLSFSISELTKKHPDILEKIRKVIEDRKKQNKSS